MKSLEKIESLLNAHRERVSLLLIMLVISLHLLSCESMLADTAEVETPLEPMPAKATTAMEKQEVRGLNFHFISAPKRQSQKQAAACMPLAIPRARDI